MLVSEAMLRNDFIHTPPGTSTTRPLSVRGFLTTAFPHRVIHSFGILPSITAGEEFVKTQGKNSF
jgi:hypothetical protein